jgi:hypothetical protein
MRKLKELFDLIFSIGRAWQYILPIAFVIGTAVYTFVHGTASATIQFRIPFLLFITIILLALYPPAKFLEWAFKKNAPRPFQFFNLLWKPSRWSFIYPSPICPEPGCGYQVIYRIEPRIFMEPVGDGYHKQAITRELHIYECFKHGKLNVPDISIRELRENARIFQNDPSNKRTRR